MQHGGIVVTTKNATLRDRSARPSMTSIRRTVASKLPVGSSASTSFGVNQCPSHRHALALPLLAGYVAQPVSNHAFNRWHRSLRILLVAPFKRRVAQHFRRKLWQQMMLLINKAQELATQCRSRLLLAGVIVCPIGLCGSICLIQPASKCSKVLLPEPERPTMATRPPAATCRPMSRNTPIASPPCRL